MNDVKRRTIYVGDALAAFLATGRVEGATVSERIDRLAERYAALLRDFVPLRWTAGEWATVMQIVDEQPLTRATDAAVIAVRLKQQGKRAGAGPDLNSLAYRFENLKLVEQLAVIDIAERALAANVEPENLATWLREHDVTLT